MTNQQAPEIYTLHTVPNKGERPWSGIYAVRADAEHDAKVLRDATGRDWSVVRLVVADTNDRVPEAWTNLLAYVLQDELYNRLTPRVIDIAYAAFMQAKRPNDEDGGASDWFNDTRPMVRELIARLRKDLIEKLAGAPQPVSSAPVVLSDDLRDRLVAISKAIADQDDRTAQAMLREILAAPQPSPTAQAPATQQAGDVHGDLLPKIGSRVFIRHGRDDDTHACIVTGYYAWGDLKGDKRLHRVFVRMVYEGTSIEQARMLCDCYPTAGAALAAISRPSPTAQAADSVQEDAARLDFLIDQRAYVVSDPDACPSHWLRWARPDGSTWVQVDAHPTPRAAIDAARN